jgi:thiamine biosynthesis lipoprotein
MTLQRINDIWVGHFEAMASSCDLLIDHADPQLASHLFELAQQEALRIEQKFSRYRKDNIIFKINNTDGHRIEVDEETANLLDFSAACYEMSEGHFDITSGLLRQVWHFDGSDLLPNPADVSALLPRIGWEKVTWQRPDLMLPLGMEIDLGGIGKEYAVDKTAEIISQYLATGVLINYGGDLFSLGPRRSGLSWNVGIDDPDQTGDQIIVQVPFSKGGLATSGDARRYLLKDGVRYSHILDPRTGWPVLNAPRSVTVAEKTCMEAGMMATFAMMHGKDARSFLQEQGVPFWLL